jgi:hypothetical protein
MVEFSGHGRVDPIFTGVIETWNTPPNAQMSRNESPKAMVSPTGFDTLCDVLPIRGEVHRRVA